MLTVAEVLEALTHQRFESARQPITDAVVDSRLVIPGALFVALPGERKDGHNFVQDAFQRGAHLALIQRPVETNAPILDLRTLPLQADAPQPPLCLLVQDSLKALQDTARFWRRKLHLKVIGITGSVGKSTTKELIAEVLSRRYATLKSPGNLNNEIGLPLTILRLSESHERAVLEMGFYVIGEIAFLCEIALPHIGVVTNVGTVHAERAGSQEAIAQGKSELVQALPPAPHGVAILNIDDPYVRQMAQKTQAKVFFYGLDPQADLWADEIQSHGLEGISFRVHYRNEILHLRIPLLGRHSVHTALRAIAVGLADNLTWQEIVEGLQSTPIQLRLTVVRTEQGALILDDSYNAAPESTLAALNLLAELDGRKIAVLGDMLELGIYEAQGHELVGRRAAEVADLLLTVGERGKIIAAAARRAGMRRENIQEVNDALEAIPLLQKELHEGDIVLVKGSHGMRMDRIVSALEIHE
ncbi:MAG: UDP-N-acetylmuramoylalanyl-D-glutamyl-2, 6-diaminopimelate--D-alanyl-D-alanine ligase [Anaerolineae bacterium]|jgi:UDP-N-acetylmuramoyl-tripeptide--D-alanyl-D-alanine ligase|nr:MAG: UDP-N-acetylmuramoylalanyl-D-glutamyl-2, 6-diaminopimelate--D-alanyl-D-alanine ligase [Anaerolineae bacterium]